LIRQVWRLGIPEAPKEGRWLGIHLSQSARKPLT